MHIDKQRSEICVSGIVQRHPDSRINDRWEGRSTAFVGVAGGTEEKDFPILLAANRTGLYRAALEELGWQPGRRYSWRQALRRAGLTEKTRLEDFQTGDPVICILEFERDGRAVRMPLQEAIRSRIRVAQSWVEVPYTPHFVFTGAGEENRIRSGCVFCPSNCVGGIITDNASGPVQTYTQELRIDWTRLPPSGTPVTVRMRSIR